jgi:hypothetical protein
MEILLLRKFVEFLLISNCAVKILIMMFWGPDLVVVTVGVDCKKVKVKVKVK